MAATLSPRLAAALAALPLERGMRVLEVGCGPGALARAIAERVGAGEPGGGAVLGVDRSPAAIAAAERSCDVPGVRFRVAAAETLRLPRGEAPYDLVVAIRVGALDGRHPELEAQALAHLAAATVPGAQLWTDGGDPLVAVPLER
ncbi:class I SAM-dependent methyltransferase [Agrococcus terreus]|uniref:Methyltransferase type 12 n=1 Tax=Agrococcus terreus TaxID=574649 RepID=A0ABQ2KS04_9MICO|nr:class I SAM-dependent methyltransferase [Agrococcus terreus]GGN89814.1 methyltransferase type 12 [Agrococcus terreus]